MDYRITFTDAELSTQTCGRGEEPLLPCSSGSSPLHVQELYRWLGFTAALTLAIFTTGKQ
jgi:hypothetical protein